MNGVISSIGAVVNRSERRAAKAISRRQTLAMNVAIHEAGHSVARMLTAEEFGRSTDSCVVSIEVDAPGSGHIGVLIDGSTRYQVQATSYGVTFSEELGNFVQRYFPDGAKGYNGANLRERQVAFAQARQEGLAVDRWLDARLLIDVFGAAAEAKFLGRPTDDIWNDAAAEGDFKEAVIAATMAGYDQDATLRKVSAALARAVDLLERPEVWNAIKAVANALPNSGTIDGSRVYQIASHFLEPAGR